MKHYIIIILLIVGVNATLAQSPKPRFLQIRNEQDTVFCGVADVIFTHSKKAVGLSTPYGELQLKVTRRKVDEYGSIEGEDHNGNLYIVSAIQNNAGGYGFQFVPKETYRMTFIVATQDLCP